MHKTDLIWGGHSNGDATDVNVWRSDAGIMVASCYAVNLYIMLRLLYYGAFTIARW